MRSNDQHLSTLLEASLSPMSSPMSSDLHKARVRAALFKKLEPVRVGRFILLEQLGAGNMGEIYAAYDEQLDRRVALKLCRYGSELTAKADVLLLREAKALAQVSHPNVVQIYEVGTHAGRLFIAMELVRGQTLTAWLEQVAQLPRPHRQREILRRFIAAGRGLEAAHAAGVAHRDFKPDNVLVGEDGRVRVVDFGLARVLADDATARAPGTLTGGDRAVAGGGDPEHAETVQLAPAESPVDPDATVSLEGIDPSASVAGALRLTAATRLTRTGTLMGTPRFMAPEQIRGVVADHRSDQFSFCVALYHALYGAFPFAGERPQELLDSIETGVVGLEHGAGLAVRLRKALRRGLSVDPAERFPSMGDLLAALESGTRRRRAGVAGAVLLLVVAVVAAVSSFRPSRPGDPCAGAGDGIASSWSAERQAAVDAAFSRSDLPYAGAGWQGVKQRIDAYADRWRTEASSACRATNVNHVQSEQLFDRRMLCLERGRRHVAALVSELAAGAPDSLQHAIDVAESLPDPSACTNPETMMYGLEPPPPALASEVAAVREQLARAFTLERMGRTEESLRIAREARARAERLKYPPVHAEALVQVARALDGRQTADARSEAQGLYFDALDLAEAARYDQLAAAIWDRLVLLAVQMDSGTQQAHAWWRRGAAAVHRMGDSAYEAARSHHLLGEIYYRDSKYAEAADEESRAISAISGAPAQRLELSRYYDALAKSLEPQDRVDEAIQLHEQALEIAIGALGQAHPDVIKRRLNYGLALEKQGKYARARAVLEAALASLPPKYRDASLDAGLLHSCLSEVAYEEGRLDDATLHGRESLQIYQRAGAPDHRRAEAYARIASAEFKRRNFAEALAMYERALALRRELGPDHFQVGVNEGSIAETLVGLSRYDDAMVHVREAERIFARGSAHGRRFQAWILTVRGEVLVGQQELGAAVQSLEEALPLLDAIPDPSNQALAMWSLARALHGLGRDPARVRLLAEKSRALFASLGASEAGNRDDVSRFMRQLSPGSALPAPAIRP